MEIKTIKTNDPWPDSISDGLILVCSICNQKPHFDYTVSDDFWKSIVPEDLQLGVICLPCLDKLAEDKNESISFQLKKIQYTGINKTIVFEPVKAYGFDT